jgi:hypothetical protein
MRLNREIKTIIHKKVKKRGRPIDEMRPAPDPTSDYWG